MIGLIKKIILGLLLSTALFGQSFGAGINRGVSYDYFNWQMWGDSLTGGVAPATTYPAQFTTVTGFANFNGGNGGDTSTQVATRFTADTTHKGWCAVFWAGRNNYSSGATVLSDIAGMVAALPSPACYVVLSIPNSNLSTEWSGTGNYNTIIALNQSLASAYPSNYIDIRALLIAAYNSGNAEDIIDQGHDVDPSTLRDPDGTGTLNGAIASTSTCTINLTNTGVTIGAGYTLTVDSEKIYVSAASSGNVTGCTRGYAGTTAATHTNGTSFTGTDPLHLSTAGNLIVAQQVQSWIFNHLRP